MNITPLVHELRLAESAADRSVIDPMAWAGALRAVGGFVFLDSATDHPGGDPALGRYSFLAVQPFHLLVAKGSSVTLDGRKVAGDPFAILADLMARYPQATISGLPPFQGGLAGYFGYGLRHHVERVPAHSRDDHGFPDLMAGAFDLVLAIDRLEARAFLISSGYPERDEERRRQRAEARIAWALERLAAPVPPVANGNWAIAARPDLDATRFKDMVRRTIRYIEEGDIYQANITQRFRARLHAGIDRLALYRALRGRSPAPFAAFLEFGEVALLSSSPERFLKVEGGRIETRPIKGTRPRGRNAAEDQALARELVASEKDHAENLMIVDLLRNDISRVARVGSVKVPVLCGLETYANVHHLVSVVTGDLAPGRSAVDLLRAAFPGGSVTGAPKIRAMEIIAELEPTERGPYCGAIGYLGFDGSMDSSIIIRTYCVNGLNISFQVGGGIVADSDPEAELEESLVKARALIETLAQGDAAGHAESAA